MERPILVMLAHAHVVQELHVPRLILYQIVASVEYVYVVYLPCVQLEQLLLSAWISVVRLLELQIRSQPAR